ncbi:MAG: GNAT family N-acetyltransferase [Ilumatobacteraceae bacterium]
MTNEPLSITLRTATVDDLGEIITVQRAAFLVEAQLFGHADLPPLSETIDEARSVLSDGITEVTVAELQRSVGPRLVGVVRVKVTDGAAYIGRLAVAPDMMRTGVGSRLMQFVHDHPPVGAERFTLFTAGLNVSNQRWYTGHGYRKVDIVTDHLGFEIVAMERPLQRPRGDLGPDFRAAPAD